MCIFQQGKAWGYRKRKELLKIECAASEIGQICDMDFKEGGKEFKGLVAGLDWHFFKLCSLSREWAMELQVLCSHAQQMSFLHPEQFPCVFKKTHTYTVPCKLCFPLVKRIFQISGPNVCGSFFLFFLIAY